MADDETAAAEAAVVIAAAQDGLPTAVSAAFEPPLLLLPFRASELPPEIKKRTDELVETNMRAIYDASGWSEENEAPEGANGEVLYLLLFQQPTEPAAATAGEVERKCDGEEAEAKRMVILADAIIGFVAAEFSVESDKASLYIVELQLAPKAQRQGLGAKLTAAAVSCTEPTIQHC